MTAADRSIPRKGNYGCPRGEAEEEKESEPAADPVSREVESNDNMTLADVIAPGKAVDGEIEAAVNDVDFFRVTLPRRRGM